MRVYVFRLAMLTLALLGPVVARGDDQQIAEQIIQQLDSEKQAGTLKGFSIDLSVEEGTVWLSGRVANAEQHAKALDIARRIPGVTQVVNDLTVNGAATNFTDSDEGSDAATPAAPANRTRASNTVATRNAPAAPQAAPTPAKPRPQNPVGGLFSNLGNAMQNAARRNPTQATTAPRNIYQQTAAVEPEEWAPVAPQPRQTKPAAPQANEPMPAVARANAIGSGVAPITVPSQSRRVVQAVLPLPESEPEPVAATSEPLTREPAQRSLIARPVAIESVEAASPQPLSAAQTHSYAPPMPAYDYAQPPVPVYRGSNSQVPLAYAPARQVQHEGAIVEGAGGGPVPMHMGGSGVGIAPARYDHPSMPGYAWPSYAAYPNYAAVTYPKQYSPTAWPYIGPFYPYPQVPLGWRKVSLEWDDGWWMLDFKDRRSHTH